MKDYATQEAEQENIFGTPIHKLRVLKFSMSTLFKHPQIVVLKSTQAILRVSNGKFYFSLFFLSRMTQPLTYQKQIFAAVIIKLMVVLLANCNGGKTMATSKPVQHFSFFYDFVAVTMHQIVLLLPYLFDATIQTDNS